MSYDFQSLHTRFNKGSFKWNELAEYGIKPEENIIPFSVADMEFVTAPEIIQAIKHELDSSIMGYANATQEYYQSVCNWIKTRHGWEAKPEWILPSHGIVDAFFAAVRAYSKPGDGVILNTPVYYPMYSAINLQGRRLVENPLINKGNRYEIDFEDLEQKAKDPGTTLLILCSPHNPCGRVWTREELTRVGEICLKNNVLVISDEIHFDLLMPGHKHTIFASISDEFADNSIVCTAPSKTFNIAGLQTSNIFIPNENLREKFLRELQLSNPNPKCNVLGYVAGQAAYENCSGWLDEALKIIDTNRKIISDFIAREFDKKIKVYDLEGTYLLWMDFNGLGLGFKELEKKNRREAKLFFDEGYLFGKAGEGYERWNIACPTKYIQAALERLKGTYL
ncbi:MAG: pyridoxal phosphate-dependent aminotransferase [Synergistaceae bacterium]|nr:pyridoxal phosphate-dependent aminotransferase [Synergistaceae bacterium]